MHQRSKMENIEIRECVTYRAPLAQTAQKQCSVWRHNTVLHVLASMLKSWRQKSHDITQNNFKTYTNFAYLLRVKTFFNNIWAHNKGIFYLFKLSLMRKMWRYFLFTSIFFISEQDYNYMHKQHTIYLFCLFLFLKTFRSNAQTTRIEPKHLSSGRANEKG